MRVYDYAALVVVAVIMTPVAILLWHIVITEVWGKK